MTALVLDAGAFIAIDRGDRATTARLRIAQQRGVELRTTSIVVAQVWRDPTGRQAQLARLLNAIDIIPVDLPLARDAGILLGRANMSDAVDATVALIATPGDRILTSDPDDLRRLTTATGLPVAIIPC